MKESEVLAVNIQNLSGEDLHGIKKQENQAKGVASPSFGISDYRDIKDPEWLQLHIYKKEDMSDLFNVFIQKDEFLMIKENSIIEFWTRVKGITVQFSSNKECEEVYQHIQGCIINNESNLTEALQFGILVKIM